ncbi:hypothetical protein V8C86DRAFT_3131643 [Haematococcus lacustris]
MKPARQCSSSLQAGAPLPGGQDSQSAWLSVWVKLGAKWGGELLYVSMVVVPAAMVARQARLQQQQAAKGELVQISA